MTQEDRRLEDRGCVLRAWHFHLCHWAPLTAGQLIKAQRGSGRGLDGGPLEHLLAPFAHPSPLHGQSHLH